MGESAVKFTLIFYIWPRCGFSLKVVFLLPELYIHVVILQSFNRVFLNAYYILGTVPNVGGIKIKEAPSKDGYKPSTRHCRWFTQCLELLPP